MALEALDHYTIQCADLVGTRDFYCDVLGLKEGYRPDLGFKGYWLYCGDAPVVHLMEPRATMGESGTGTGAFDHIAFRGRDAGDTIAWLKAGKIAFGENLIAEMGLHQIFVRDPNGILVEMNFRT